MKEYLKMKSTTLDLNDVLLGIKYVFWMSVFALKDLGTILKHVDYIQ
jgi:hypothetical protein